MVVMTLRQWVECSTLGSREERVAYETSFLYGLELIQCAGLEHVMEFDEAYWNAQFLFHQRVLLLDETCSDAVH